MIDTTVSRKARPLASAKLPPEIDLARLAEAVRDSTRQLKPFREKRMDVVRQYAGKQYGDGATEWEVPFNLIGLYVSIMTRALVAKTPQQMLSTTDPAQRAAVAACEQWGNEEADRMDLGTVLQRAANDALYLMGIVKVGLAHPGDAAVRGWGLRAGTPFAQVVDPEDYVVDLHAKDRSEVSFEGHRYRMPLAAAKKMFKRKRDLELQGEDERGYNADGDDRITTLQRGNASGMYEFEEYVSLWEIYLPRHKLVLTFLDQTDGIEGEESLLHVQKWIGPPTGPYHVLGFGIVPGNLIPKAPLMDLIVLHKAINRQYRKLIEDTDRWKSILPVPAGTDANAVINAHNGQAVQYDGKRENLQELTFGGPGQGVLQMAMHLKDLFDFGAGNLSAIGGLAPQSKTATQDKLLAEGSSRTVGDMQDTTIRFVSRVFDAIDWYHWFHPEKVMETQYKVQGLPDIASNRKVYPRGAVDEMGQPRSLRRDGPAPQVKVDPYSLSHSTPQQRLAFLDASVAAVQPILGLLQQQGVFFDGEKYMKMRAKYGQEPDLNEIFTLSEPVPRQGGDGGGDGGGMPANTSREYIRRSLGGESQGAQQAELETAVEKQDGGFNKPMG